MPIKCYIFLFSPGTVYTASELLLKFDDCFTSSCKVLFSAFWAQCVTREIKINVYRKRQTSESSWEFLRIENKEIKTVPNDSSG